LVVVIFKFLSGEDLNRSPQRNICYNAVMAYQAKNKEQGSKMHKLNCWEIKKCGREPKGTKVGELGICPVALEQRLDGVNDGKYAGRACWTVAGSFCGGKIQGTFASKRETCIGCDCYNQITQEEGLRLQTTREILEKLNYKILSVGMPLILRTQKHEELRTNIIGWKANDYLMAQLPDTKGKPLSANEQCSIRYLKDGDAYLFETKVVAVQNYPCPMLVFKYPAAVRKMPLRKHMRFRTSIPANICCSEKGTAYSDALIVDLSMEGCRLKIKTSHVPDIEINNVYKLKFTFLNSVLEDIDCVVRNINTTDNLHFIGAEFSCPSPKTIKELETLVDFFQKYQFDISPFY